MLSETKVMLEIIVLAKGKGSNKCRDLWSLAQRRVVAKP